MLAVITYLIYLAISISMTIWVANSLQKGGVVFLKDDFNGNKELADSINHLLVVGFYLLNLGYICMMMKSNIRMLTVVSSLELIATKIGYILFFLGIFHMINLFILSKFRAGQVEKKPEPYVDYLAKQQG